jgi:carbamoyl-phosphate synthase small subunit
MGVLSGSWGMPTPLPECGFEGGRVRFRDQVEHPARVAPVRHGCDGGAGHGLRQRMFLAMKPDGVFLSNGPADPAAVDYAARNIQNYWVSVPLMGICLGHQLLGIALGGKTYRMKFGHHGINHPVMRLETRAVEVTSQNHNFAIDGDSLGSDIEVTHVNLNDQSVEGLRSRTVSAFSVQYHPEAGPGPHDPFYLFGLFRETMLH